MLICQLFVGTRDVKRAIAGEVVKGPFENAQSEIINQNLSDQMEARMGDGLDVIESDDLVNDYDCRNGWGINYRYFGTWKSKLTMHPVLVYKQMLMKIRLENGY